MPLLVILVRNPKQSNERTTRPMPGHVCFVFAFGVGWILSQVNLASGWPRKKRKPTAAEAGDARLNGVRHPPSQGVRPDTQASTRVQSPTSASRVPERRTNTARASECSCRRPRTAPGDQLIESAHFLFESNSLSKCIRTDHDGAGAAPDFSTAPAGPNDIDGRHHDGGPRRRGIGWLSAAPEVARPRPPGLHNRRFNQARSWKKEEGPTR